MLGVANAHRRTADRAARRPESGPGDEVIFSSHTMVATAAAIHFAGAIPVPVECGPDHLIDPAAVTAAITPRTRAILPTQLNGRTADMDALARIAQRARIADRRGRRAGAGLAVQRPKAGTFGIGGGHQFLSGQSAGLPGRRRRGDDANNVAFERMLPASRSRPKRRRRNRELGTQFAARQSASGDSRLPRLASLDARRSPAGGPGAALSRALLANWARSCCPPGPDGDPDHLMCFRTTKSKPSTATPCANSCARAASAPWSLGEGRRCISGNAWGSDGRLPFTERFSSACLLAADESVA